MADQSPAFMPPAGTVKDTDPMVMKVPMTETDWAARKSAQPAFREGLPPITHIANGR